MKARVYLAALALLTTSGGCSKAEPSNEVPVANTPAAFQVDPASQVTLDGSLSHDPDGTLVSYRWTQLSGAPIVTLTAAASATASFTAPTLRNEAHLVFRLTVTDNKGASSTATVVVTVLPAPSPTAVAPENFSVMEGDNVSLDGSGSFAPNTIVSFRWRQTAGQSVVISNADAAIASFVAPEVARDQTTVLGFSLTVTDNNTFDDVATLMVTITDTPPVVLTGRVTFDRVPHNSVGALDYAATERAAVRGARIELLDADTSAILASTSSDADGNYELLAPVASRCNLRVKAEMSRSSPGPSWYFRVVDNTSNDALYTMDSGIIVVSSTPLSHDIHAASGWGGAGYNEARVAAPFAILDAVYQAVQKVVAVEADAQFPDLDLHWSVNNVIARDTDSDRCRSYASGMLGTSFYTANPDCPGIYIVGAADSDTDEYDSHIIVHEWGHYFEDEFSRSDSIGGSHGTGDKLDLRLAMGEGWGTALSGIVTDNPLYQDAFGSGQSRGFEIDIEANPPLGPSSGWFSEDSLQSLIYDFYDARDDGADRVQLGFAPIYSVMRNGQRQTTALTSIFSFASHLKLEAPSRSAAIDALLSSQGIVANDEFGTGESNDGGDPVNLPVFKPLNVGGTGVEVCSSAANGEFNKLGNSQFIRLHAAASKTHTFSATGMGGDTPVLYVYRQGLFEFARSGVGSSQEFLTAGDYVIEVAEEQNIDLDEQTSRDACTTVTVHKPGAPISMRYEILSGAPEVGKAIDIQMQFESKSESAISATLSSVGEFALLSNQKTWKGDLTRRNDNAPRVKVVPKKTGLHFVHLMASIDVGGKLRARPFAIAVRVGNAPIKFDPVGRILRDARGERLVVQAAQ